MLAIEFPFPQFADLDGRPLDAGFVYVGVQDQNPETDPVAVYWDEAMTQPAAQPLRTKNGMLARNGIPAMVFTAGDHSLTVRNSKMALVVYAQSSGTFNVSGQVAAFQSELSTGGESTGSALIGFLQAGPGGAPRSVQDKLRQGVSYRDHDTLNQTIALAAGMRDVDLGGETVTLLGPPVNEFGSRLRNGAVMIPSQIAGYFDRINTYVDEGDGPMFHRERLAAWWLSVTANTFQNVIIYGDSTVEQDAGYPIKSHMLFKMALQAAGVNNCLTVNRGLSGTSWSDLNALPDLGATTKLIVIKYGINDAAKGGPLAALATDMRAKLSAIRANASGVYSQLSILLMGPSTAYRPSANQDAEWFEQVRNVYLEVAREFQCAYFDTYGYLQDAKGAPGLWMDSFEGGQGIHPTPVASYWIWFEGIKNCVLGDGAWNVAKSNHAWNIGHATAQAFPTGEPQTYPFGWSQWGVLVSDGWPSDGMLIVERQADGVTRQTLVTLDQAPRLIARTGSGLLWTQWTGIPVSMTALVNGWAPKGGGYQAPRYQVGDDGFVDLDGVITGGTLGTSCYVLPANVRPQQTHIFLTAGAASTATAASVSVFSDGNVIIQAAANTTISLGGVRFKVLA